MRVTRPGIVATAAAILASGLVAISSPAHAASNKICSATDLKSAGGMDALVKAAKAEGELNIITVPRDWANYGEAIDIFTKAFDIKINDDNPEGSSAYEIQTIKTVKDPAKQPDAVDIGISVLPDALGIGRKSLFTPYKVATWNDIPSVWKDSTGLWYGDYYGVLAIAYDASLTKAPKSIKELITDPAYKGALALSGDPTASQQALMSLFAFAAANGGSVDNIMPGIDAIKSAKANGNFVSVIGNSANYAAGAYKVSLNWDFNGPGGIASAKTIGKNLRFVMPNDVALQGTPYLQAINAKAPHCAAARLWEEYLYSQKIGKLSTEITAADKKLSGSKLFNLLMGGQNIWRSGAAHPITEAAMVKKKTLIAAPEGFDIPKTAKIVAPDPDQQSTQKAIVITEWPKI
ncbi:MAG: ABC transporter substrate-binding protein [Actinobacteria bacterium]|jgi:putative spermidine/putrescine transport system substrate-binding protein|nr:ABC transporter substrate-binding protein [Actinomycetota bacterium]NDF10283.1 ABC transporter substrate-binding protein [Actinomycetota bacterium]